MDINIIEAPNKRDTPYYINPEKPLGFGQERTDHVFLMSYSTETG